MPWQGADAFGMARSTTFLDVALLVAQPASPLSVAIAPRIPAMLLMGMHPDEEHTRFAEFSFWREHFFIGLV